MANIITFNDEPDDNFTMESDYNGEGELDADTMHDQVIFH